MKDVSGKGYAKDDVGKKHPFDFTWEKLETNEELTSEYSTDEILELVNKQREIDERTPAAAKKRAEVKTAVAVTLQRENDALRYAIVHLLDEYLEVSGEFGKVSPEVTAFLKKVWQEHCS